MSIRSPCERVGKPLIGSNHMHSMARREGDETSMLVECNILNELPSTAIERRDVMAFVCECLQPMVEEVGDDDSALVIDAHSLRETELAWLVALMAELEQERAIDRRQYLHSMIASVSNDDSASIMIDRCCCWMAKLAWLRSLVAAANLEQERKVDRRQEHQSIIASIDDDDAAMMLVDRNTLRIREIELSGANRIDARRQERRLRIQRP